MSVRTKEKRMGSSPLARGLPRAGPWCSRPGGIIPARAGFTLRTEIICRYSTDHPRSRGVYTVAGPRAESGGGSSPLARGLPRWFHTSSPQAVDHPRSRGVYPDGTVSPLEMTGSSPLARGLPGIMTAMSARRGIIPARAGFTGLGPADGARAADHPRSRGVYPCTGTSCGRPAGSSPLARGLPRRRSPGRAVWRIIPARAGFTPPDPGRRGGRGDHPRSRGVYLRGRRALVSGAGSSPLARGLLDPSPEQLRAGRIIPARAGFTRRRGYRLGERPDHPRSRGVYVLFSALEDQTGGSSPLARVLLMARHWGPDSSWIIPARAGFTPSTTSWPGTTADHPRSRGVYSVPPTAVVGGSGSSPLARGLRKQPLDVDGTPRIIPARAGFTHRHVVAPVEHPDHPRSRGVYTQSGRTATRAAGSSPLARGLQWAAGPFLCPAGIIPARAGFTRPPTRWAADLRDHPRSRGVYGPDPSPRWRRRGSSPLARGLRKGAGRLMPLRGIIPARAGFTGHARAARALHRDHPRSRGVY